MESAPGFKHSVLRPLPNSQLQSAAASLETPYGTLRSGWRLTEGGIELEFEIPFNATAEICLPDADGVAVLENGAPLAEGPLLRSSGVWRYTYVPNGKTIDRRVQPILRPDI